MHPAFGQIDHRPWPLPKESWLLSQAWRDLAFIHYPVDADRVRALLPAGLELETFEGQAWVGVVPFEMVGVTPRWFHGLVSMPKFPELNVRTYVRANGVPGVWFFSLDTTAASAVMVGRRQFKLPYHRARMSIARAEGWFIYNSERLAGGARFEGRYRGVGPVFYPKPGSFEHWAAERYCLYLNDGSGSVKRVEVHHVAWPLQACEAQIDACTMLEAAGVGEVSGPARCHFSSGVEAVSYGVKGL